MRALPRRSVLRAAGAAVALPWLDAMVPAFAERRSASPPIRLVTVYAPNGMAMREWTPEREGADVELSPILAPLEGFRSRLRIISGLSTLGLPTVPAYHAGAATKFLTGTSPSDARGTVVHAGVSMDQVAARHLGAATQVPSLELGLEASEIVGACDAQYSCAYQNTVCWSTPGTPLPMESEPMAVFERLYGDRADLDPAARRRALSDDRSVLDSVREGLGRLRRDVGPSDRVRLDGYVESIRSVERRLHEAEKRAGADVPDATALTEAPTSFMDRAELMTDLITLAFQSDLTRVCTLMTGREASVRTYPEVGVAEGHHEVSHHQNDPERLARLARVNVLHVKVLAYLLRRLHAVEGPDGPLLDRTVVLFGAGMSDSNRHRHDDLPVLVAGSSALTDDAHVRHPDGTPLANLHVGLLDSLGVHVERFGNSNGSLR